MDRKPLTRGTASTPARTSGGRPWQTSDSGSAAAPAIRIAHAIIDCGAKDPAGTGKTGDSLHRPEGRPAEANAHDCTDEKPGKSAPCGENNAAAGCECAGIDTDIARFPAISPRRRRDAMGRDKYPVINRPTIAADGSGVNRAQATGDSVHPGWTDIPPSPAPPRSDNAGASPYPETANTGGGPPTGRRVIVNVMTAPAISSPPANKKALVKSPVAATMYPVAIGAARPKMLPPN